MKKIYAILLSLFFSLQVSTEGSAESLSRLDKILAKMFEQGSSLTAEFLKQWAEAEVDVTDKDTRDRLRSRLSIAEGADTLANSPFVEAARAGNPPTPELLQLFGNILGSVNTLSAVQSEEKKGNALEQVAEGLGMRYGAALLDRKGRDLLRPIAQPKSGTLVAQFIASDKTNPLVTFYDVWFDEKKLSMDWSIRKYSDRMENGALFLSVLNSDRPHDVAVLVAYFDLAGVDGAARLRKAIDAAASKSKGKLIAISDDTQARLSECVDARFDEEKGKIPPDEASTVGKESVVDLTREVDAEVEAARVAKLRAQFEKSCSSALHLSELAGRFVVFDPVRNIVLSDIKSTEVNRNAAEGMISQAFYLSERWPDR